MNTREMLLGRNGINVGHVGWRYYNEIRKKAMEQEFSLSGLVVSLSIAFFIVVGAALILKLAYISLSHAAAGGIDNSFDIFRKSLYDIVA